MIETKNNKGSCFKVAASGRQGLKVICWQGECAWGRGSGSLCQLREIYELPNGRRNEKGAQKGSAGQTQEKCVTNPGKKQFGYRASKDISTVADVGIPIPGHFLGE